MCLKWLFCIAHGIRDFEVYCLSSWAPFVHVCWRSGLKVLKVWEIGGHLGGIWGIFIIFRRVSFWNHTISLKHERSGLVAV